MTPENTGGPAPAQKAPAGPEAKLRERLLQKHRANTATDQHKELTIPGHEGLLVARYHRNVEWEVIEEAATAIASGRGSGVLLNSMLDLIIAACEEILVRRGNGDLVPVSMVFPELGEGSTRYTRELAAAFNPGKDYSEADARACVLALFPSALAVPTHGKELQGWLEFAEDQEGFSNG
jgi:hypothetical protein